MVRFTVVDKSLEIYCKNSREELQGGINVFDIDHLLITREGRAGLGWGRGPVSQAEVSPLN